MGCAAMGRIYGLSLIHIFPADLTWSKTDLIYTGSEQSVSATVANALEGDSFAIAYEGNTQTEAGDSLSLIHI